MLCITLHNSSSLSLMLNNHFTMTKTFNTFHGSLKITLALTPPFLILATPMQPTTNRNEPKTDFIIEVLSTDMMGQLDILLA